jgi:hypothetical protein
MADLYTSKRQKLPHSCARRPNRRDKFRLKHPNYRLYRATRPPFQRETDVTSIAIMALNQRILLCFKGFSPFLTQRDAVFCLQTQKQSVSQKVDQMWRKSGREVSQVRGSCRRLGSASRKSIGISPFPCFNFAGSSIYKADFEGVIPA